MNKRKIHLLAFTSLVLMLAITGIVWKGSVLAVDLRQDDLYAVTTKLLSQGQYSSQRVRVVYKEDLERRGEDGFFNVIKTVEVEGNQRDNDSLANTSEQVDNVRDTLVELLSDPEVAYAAPDYLGSLAAWTDNGTQAYPGDYDVTGPTFNHWYYDSGKVKEMWHTQDCPSGPLCGGSSDVVVAVIDTGLAYGAFDDETGDGFTEKNFTAVMDDVPNLWTNSGEIPGNGMDDDCNGVVDDAYGMDTFAYVELEITDRVDGIPLSDRTCVEGVPIDFSGDSNTFRRKPGNPVDTYGHGSFVTGMIAGQVDNGGGTVSPAFNVSIMTLAASINTTNNTHTSLTYDESTYHYFWMSDVQYAIDYAGAYGADIVNMSLGGFPNDSMFQAQIDYWYGQGVLFIAASGNQSTSGSLQPVQYPAAFNNVIAVGAVNENNTRSSYSNGGSNLDLVAYVGQGGSLGTATYQETLTCYGCTSVGPFNGTAATTSVGTSFAAPQVAAAAAIIKSNNPGLSVDDLRLLIVASTTDIGSSGRDNATGFGVLNFQKANALVASEMDIENFTVYRYINGDRAWIWVANPSETEVLFVDVDISGSNKGVYVVQPQENLPIWYENTFTGPVKLTGSTQMHVSHKQRTLEGKLNEVIAIPADKYSKTFYYPVYRYINGDGAWIWVANPSYTETASVNVSLSGENKGEYQMSPRTNMFVAFQGEFRGPVVIESDIDVYTTMKSRTGGGLEEFKGISVEELSDRYLFPVYRYVNGDGAWVWVGNPSKDVVVEVQVLIAGNLVDSKVVPAGENISLSYPGVFAGPLEIIASGDIYATLKSRSGGVINEFSGITSNEFSSSYSYPIYRYINNDTAWIWFGNPSLDQTANVSVYIAGALIGEYQVHPSANSYSHAPGVFAGPVKIISDIPIYSTLKSRSAGSLNEFVGINE